MKPEPYLDPKIGCACGCEGIPGIAKKTDRRLGWERGKHRKFVRGHNRRAKYEDNYLVEDRGYVTPCWIWQGKPSINGYGQVRGNNRNELAHRYFFRMSGRDLPKGKPLDHLCDVRICVNPEHLKPTTNAENVRRGRSTKLTAEIVADIRASHESHAELSRRYGVGPKHIADIRKRRSWR